MSKKELNISQLKQETKNLAKKYQLDLLLLFGSRVKGKIHPMSDYDFGYISRHGLGYKEEYSLQKELARIFEIRMNKREDNLEVVNLVNLDPLFKYQILKNNRIIYQSPGTYSRFFVFTLQEYFDSYGLLKLREKIIGKNIQVIRKNL